MMAQYVKPADRVTSLTKCVDTKWDITSSLYISEIERETRLKNIRWTRDLDVPANGDLQYKYFSLYRNKNGMKVILDLRETLSEGIELNCLYVNGDKRVSKVFDEWSYPDELQDLMGAVEEKRTDIPNEAKVYGPKKYDNISKLTDPYYNSYNRKTYTEEKVLNSRGRKAKKLLENLDWEYNCQILGE